MAPDLIRASAGATERRARTVMVWPERGAGLSPLVAGCDHWISPMDFAGADMGSERRQSSCAALRAGLSQRRFRWASNLPMGEITSGHMRVVYLVLHSITGMARKSMLTYTRTRAPAQRERYGQADVKTRRVMMLKR